MLGENNTAKNPDVREKISAKLKGREFSEEHRKKLSQYRIGKKMSDETKKKIANSLRGKRHLSDEEIERRRQKLLSDDSPLKRPEVLEKLKLIRQENFKYMHTPEARKKAVQSRIGLKRSAETRLKQSLVQRGEKGSNWQGGLTALNTAIRNSSYYVIWRMNVLKRDELKCVSCGDNQNLEADHIKPFSVIIRENNIKSLQEAFDCFELWDISNGRTLCRECHKETETYGWKIVPMLVNVKNMAIN